MERFKTLMLREWLQHRLGWTLLVGLPLALGLLLAVFGSIEIDGAEAALPGTRLAALVTLIGSLATAALIGLLMTATSLLLMSNLARRDHPDRANEFWLSLPVGHTQALGAPLLAHLLLAPALALLAGLAGGLVVSSVMAIRLTGVGEWLALPWSALFAALLAVSARLLVGLPLALLWLAPLLLAVILAQAWLRRWGLVALGAGGLIAGAVLEQMFGQPLLRHFVTALFTGAGRSLTFGVQANIQGPEDVDLVLSQVPGWAMADLGAAFGALASPYLLGGMVLTALMFAGLIDWRRRQGAGG
jgi:hypothetical protein